MVAEMDLRCPARDRRRAVGGAGRPTGGTARQADGTEGDRRHPRRDHRAGLLPQDSCPAGADADRRLPRLYRHLLGADPARGAEPRHDNPVRRQTGGSSDCCIYEQRRFPLAAPGRPP